MSLYTTIVTPFVSCCIEYQNSLHYSPMNRRIDPISISYKSQGKCLMEIRIVVLRRPFLYYWSVCVWKIFAKSFLNWIQQQQPVGGKRRLPLKSLLFARLSASEQHLPHLHVNTLKKSWKEGFTTEALTFCSSKLLSIFMWVSIIFSFLA